MKETRKMWPTKKGSYVISVPMDWAKVIIKKYPNKEFYYQKSNDSITFFPVKEESEVISSEITINEKDPLSKLEAHIFSAYTNNYDSVAIEIPVNLIKAEEKLKEIVNDKLLGAHLTRLSIDKYRVSFSEVKENPIKEILSETVLLFHESTKQIKECLEKFPPSSKEGITSIDLAYSIIESLELEADKKNFYLKRLLIRALHDPNTLDRTKIANIEDVIEYANINSNLERLMDLQFELMGALKDLLHEYTSQKGELKLTKGDYGFSKYYEKSSDYVKRALDGLKDAELIDALLVNRTSLGEIDGRIYSYRPDFIELKDRKIIFDIIKEHKDYAIFLVPMESKIYGMTGNATNIAEAAKNIIKPKTTVETTKIVI